MTPNPPAEIRRFELPKSLLGSWTLSTPRNNSVPLAITFSNVRVAQDWSQFALDGKPNIQTGQIMDIIAYPDTHTLLVNAEPLAAMYLQRGEPGTPPLRSCLRPSAPSA